MIFVKEIRERGITGFLDDGVNGEAFEKFFHDYLLSERDTIEDGTHNAEEKAKYYEIVID